MFVRRVLTAVVTLSAVAALGTTAVIRTAPTDNQNHVRVTLASVPSEQGSPLEITSTTADSMEDHQERLRRFRARTDRLERQQHEILDRVSRLESK